VKLYCVFTLQVHFGGVSGTHSHVMGFQVMGLGTWTKSYAGVTLYMSESRSFKVRLCALALCISEEFALK
jgi:hypothetical protein